MKLGTMFAGGRLFDVGAEAAGLTPAWAIEYDAAIAAVGAQNGSGLGIVSRVEDVDYSVIPHCDWLHASPSCKQASTANANGGETAGDLSAAQAVCRAIVAQQPAIFSLENVWGYRLFASFRRILATLAEQGYAVGYWHLNAADYGVPQTRRRLILVATRLFVPQAPVPTHYDPRGGTAHMFALPWVGWYEAIADLIPTLPPATIPAWMNKRLPMEIREALLIGGANTSDAKAAPGVGVSTPDEPSRAVNASNAVNWRAILVHPTDQRSVTTRDGEEPSFTVGGSTKPRAILVDGKLNDHGQRLTIRDGDEPAATVRASSAMKDLRAVIGPQVVRLTPQALARLQSAPDSYVLPTKQSLACTVIGNGVPCLLAKAIAEVVAAGLAGRHQRTRAA